jgi:hypothetical protein
MHVAVEGLAEPDEVGVAAADVGVKLFGADSPGGGFGVTGDTHLLDEPVADDGSQLVATRKWRAESRSERIHCSIV